MKIIVADDLPASALDLLRAEGWTVDARTGRAPDQLAADVADADAIVVRSATKVTAALIAAAINDHCQRNVAGSDLTKEATARRGEECR